MTTDSIRYSEGYKYQLREDACIQTDVLGHVATMPYAALSNFGKLTITEGYAWNGANVIKDRRSNMVASLTHDVLCQMVRLGALPASLRPQIDDEFSRQVVRAEGWAWVARLDLRGLRWFSHGAYRPSAERATRAAP